jgi:tricorn protease
MKKSLFFLVLICLAVAGSAQETMLLRQPTLFEDKIVFVYANDLWMTSSSGGEATRLTSNEGYESDPHFSPDGSMIAFTAEYDGNTDVYMIPATGGSPKRLTYHPAGDYVQGWTPEGRVLFRSSREARPTKTNRFFTIGLDGKLPEAMSIPRAAYGEVSPDGKHVAYIPITSWDPEWRNYRGGQAMPVWIVNLNSLELTRTTQKDGERHLDPVWVGNTVFYISERDYTANIWSYDMSDGTEKQWTFHKKYDVKSLDAAGDMIVYEHGGRLNILDTQGGETSELTISVKGDMNFARERWESVSGRNLTNPGLSPNGKRAIFEYRGEIFTFPKEEGSWRNITNSPGVADRYPVWSPKGDKIAWFSDESGEYQLVVADQYGENRKSYALQNPTFYFTPDWSPDGKRIAYTDTDYNMWFIELSSGKVTKIDTDRYAHPNRSMNPVWSPDSKWVAYAKQLENHYKNVFMYNVESGKKIMVTDGMVDAITPIWDESGEYLYFLASTDYGLNTGWLDMSSYDPSVSRSLYCAILSNSASSPTATKSDEEEVNSEKKEDEKKDKKEEEEMTIVVDEDGLNRRIVNLSLPSANYTGLITAPEGYVFIAQSIPLQSGLKIHKYDVKKQKPEDYAEGVSQMLVTANRKHALVEQSNSWSITGTASGPTGKDKISTNAQIFVNPTAEYAQIFKEGWRYMRDFLYVDNVHGAPWDDVYEWYEPWVQHIRHRTDLNYVVDILSGEVAVGHSYVSGGDMPDVDRVPVGLLGADYELKNGLYSIAKIYTGESWNPGLEGPLAVPGLGVREGNYIFEINGKSLSGNDNIHDLMAQTAGRPTRLLVGSSTSKSEAKEILVTPVSSEYGLRTVDWIESNRRKVDQMSDGKIAYVYIPNTGGGGFTSFNRYYFAQQDKKGVVLDERNNGGGSAADYMIDILARDVMGYFNSKANDNRPWTTPMAGLWGPKVMIINERAGSGGDLLPYMFKFKGIGPLVGTRTWGGLVGTWDTPRFIDGGRMVAPRGGFFDVDGEWAVEGEGVAPDIEVIQTPSEVVAGKDPQLERAVQEALKLLETQEFEMKPEPPAPVRWKRPEGYDKE